MKVNRYLLAVIFLFICIASQNTISPTEDVGSSIEDSPMVKSKSRETLQLLGDKLAIPSDYPENFTQVFWNKSSWGDTWNESWSDRIWEYGPLIKWQVRNSTTGGLISIKDTIKLDGWFNFYLDIPMTLLETQSAYALAFQGIWFNATGFNPDKPGSEMSSISFFGIYIPSENRWGVYSSTNASLTKTPEEPPPDWTLEDIFGPPLDPFLEFNKASSGAFNRTDAARVYFNLKFNQSTTSGFYTIGAVLVDKEFNPLAQSAFGELSGRSVGIGLDEVFEQVTGGYFKWSRIDDDGNPLYSATRGVDFNTTIEVYGSDLANVSLIFDLPSVIEIEKEVVGLYREKKTTTGGWEYDKSTGTYFYNSSTLINYTREAYGAHTIKETQWFENFGPIEIDHPEHGIVTEYIKKQIAIVYNFSGPPYWSTWFSYRIPYYIETEWGWEQHDYRIFEPILEKRNIPFSYLFNETGSSIVSDGKTHKITFRGNISTDVAPSGPMKNGEYSPPLEVDAAVYTTDGMQLVPYVYLPIASESEKQEHESLRMLTVETPIAVVRLLHKGEPYTPDWLFQTNQEETFTVKARLQGGAQYASDIDGVGFLMEASEYSWGTHATFDWSKYTIVHVLTKVYSDGRTEIEVYNHTRKTEWGEGEHYEWQYVEIAPDSGIREWREVLVTDYYWRELYWDFIINDWIEEPIDAFAPQALMQVEYLEVGNLSYNLIGDDLAVQFDITPTAELPDSEYQWTFYFGNLTWVSDYTKEPGVYEILDWVEAPVYSYINDTKDIFTTKPTKGLVFRDNFTDILYPAKQLPVIKLKGEWEPVEEFVEVTPWGEQRQQIVFSRFNPNAWNEFEQAYTGAEEYYYRLINGTEIPIKEGHRIDILNVTLNNGKSFYSLGNKLYVFQNETNIYRWIKSVNSTVVIGDNTFWAGATSEFVDSVYVNDIGLVAMADGTKSIALATWPHWVGDRYIIYINGTWDPYNILWDGMHEFIVNKTDGTILYFYNGTWPEHYFQGTFGPYTFRVPEFFTDYFAYTDIFGPIEQLPSPNAQASDIWELEYITPHLEFAYIEGNWTLAKYIGDYPHHFEPYEYPAYLAEVQGMPYFLTWFSHDPFTPWKPFDEYRPGEPVINWNLHWESLLWISKANGSIPIFDAQHYDWTIAYGQTNNKTREFEVDGWLDLKSGWLNQFDWGYDGKVHNHNYTATPDYDYVMTTAGEEFTYNTTMRVWFFNFTFVNGTTLYSTSSEPEAKISEVSAGAETWLEPEYYYIYDIDGVMRNWTEWIDYTVTLVAVYDVNESQSEYTFNEEIKQIALYNHSYYDWMEGMWFKEERPLVIGDYYTFIQAENGSKYEIIPLSQDFKHEYNFPSFNFTLDGGANWYSIKGNKTMIQKQFTTMGQPKRLDLAPLQISMYTEQHALVIGSPEFGMWEVDSYKVDEKTGALDLDGNLETTDDQYYVSNVFEAEDKFNVTEQYLFVSLMWEPNGSVWGDEFNLTSHTGMVTFNWSTSWNETHIWYHADTGQVLNASEWEKVNDTLFFDNGLPKPGYWSISWLGRNFTSANLTKQAQEEGWDWAIEDTQSWSWLWWILNEQYYTEVSNGTVTEPMHVDVTYEYAGMLAWKDNNSNNMMDIDPASLGSAELSHYWIPEQVKSISFLTPGAAWENYSDTGSENRPVNETIFFGVTFENISGIVFPFGEWSYWDWYDGQYYGSDFSTFNERPTEANTTKLAIGVGFSGLKNSSGPNAGQVKFNITVGDWNVNTPGGRDVLEDLSLAMAFYSDITLVSPLGIGANATYTDDQGQSLSNNQTAASKSFAMKSGLSNIALMNIGGAAYTWSRNASRNATVDAQSVPVTTFSAMYASESGATATSFKVQSTQFYTLVGFKWWDGYEVSVDPVFVGYSTSQSADQIAPDITNIQVEAPNPETGITISASASDLGGSGLSKVELYDIDKDKTYLMEYNPDTDKFGTPIPGTVQHYLLNYTIKAYDGAGNWRETNPQSYLFYDLIDPEINSVNDFKITVQGEEAALIQVAASDDGGSGFTVSITYTIDSVDTTDDMVYNSTSGFYEYIITDQSPGTVVTYSITVTDGDDNSVIKSGYSYAFYLDIIDPTIYSIENYTVEVSGEPTILIQANVTDEGESGIDSIKLNYSILIYNSTIASWENATPVVVDMQWNSTSEFYEYIIPVATVENATAVLYSITVTDGHGNSVTSTEKVAYLVTGFDIPPIIGTPLLSPSNPRSWNAINVSVTITDDHNIKNATLYYKINDGAWNSISMTRIGNTYRATIPAALDGSTVTYYIEAYDNAGQRSILQEASYSVIDDQLTPEITDVLEVSVAPTSSESVIITATIIDDIAVENATLYYKVDDGSWNSVIMTNKGDMFEATIPAQPHGTKVTYYIEAYDTSGKSITSNEFSYTVNDDREAPVISSVSIDKPSPTSAETVTVTAEVEDDIGLENVTLYYKVDDSDWIAITMGLSGGVYRAVIPSQPQGSQVTYFVRAFDTVGNLVDSAQQSYTVVGERTTTGSITTTGIEIGRFTISFGIIFIGLFAIGMLLVLRRRK